MTLLITPLLVMLTITLAAGPAVAATPADPSAIPAPLECQVEPLSIEQLTGMRVTPPASTPAALPALDGPAAPPETVAAIEPVLLELFACFNAGEPLRAYALYSDAYLRQIVGTMDPGALADLATPAPLDPDEWTRVLDLRDPRVLPDGRVAVIVLLDPALIPVDKMFVFILVEQNGVWLIDDVLDELEFSLP